MNLKMAAYLLALRDVMVDMGRDPQLVNRELAEALFRAMRRVFMPMDAVAHLLHPGSALRRARWRERVARRLFYRSPDWEMEEVSKPACFAFDVRHCVLAAYTRSRGEAGFCQQVFCSQDLLMARRRGEMLTRTKTIAAGADRCDFRFQQGLDSKAPR